MARVAARARRLSARRRGRARVHRRRRRRRARRGGRVGRRVVRDAAGVPRGRAASPTRRSCSTCSRGRRGLEAAAAFGPLPARLVGLALLDRRVERDRDRLQRLLVVLDGRSASRAARRAAVAPSRRRPSRAPARCGTRRSPRGARSRAAARAAARPAARSRGRRRGSPGRPSGASRPGGTASRGRRPRRARSARRGAACARGSAGGRGRPTGAAASSRFVSGVVGLAEHLQHLQPQRMAERLQLLGPVELEDVEWRRLRLAGCSCAPV